MAVSRVGGTQYVRFRDIVPMVRAAGSDPKQYPFLRGVSRPNVLVGWMIEDGTLKEGVDCVRLTKGDEVVPTSSKRRAAWAIRVDTLLRHAPELKPVFGGPKKAGTARHWQSQKRLERTMRSLKARLRAAEDLSRDRGREIEALLVLFETAAAPQEERAPSPPTREPSWAEWLLGAFGCDHALRLT